MSLDYWHKQTADKPLFPELLWSRPENRRQAGKLLIIGGNLHGFAAPAEAYSQAVKARIGVARVLVPDAIKKLLDSMHLNTVEMEFVPSTPSGSFSQKALTEFLSLNSWADGVLLAGDFGRNSETTILLEKFSEKYQGQLTITGDAADYFIRDFEPILRRPDTTLVISFEQLQKVAIKLQATKPITAKLDLVTLVEAIHDLSLVVSTNLVIKYDKGTIAAVNGQVLSSTTEFVDNWQSAVAASTAVWWLQNPNQTFKSISCALV